MNINPISQGKILKANNNLTIVILAAGMGSRMKSNIPKVCHKVGDKTMIERIVETSKELNPSKIIIVVSTNNVENIRNVLQDDVDIRLKIQQGQLGTAHAVLAAEPCCDETTDLLVLLGDTPLIKAETLSKVVNTNFDAVIVGFRNMDITKPYGRIVIDNNRVKKIVEYADATTEERNIKLCNSGMLWIKKDYVCLLRDIKNNNSKQEYYLTDIIELMTERKLNVGFMRCTIEECMGVNTHEDLHNINEIYNKNKNTFTNFHK
jgi:bifunctional UDP-N-acetylglucosamine pyrophosphorylase/glucosamine-1-phosphate N-acetyltransferase